ncbi:MAG: hypothetical protein HON70_19355, partial [Lentisphaerae bacterium]|nr:hypothetical protein [Lentisphaerota bacterium]
AGPFGAWTDIWSDSLSAEDVLAALRSGSFCASTGVTVSSLTLNGASIAVNAPNAGRIRFVGHGGRTLLEADTSAAEYCLVGDEGYVRIECENDNRRWPEQQPGLGQWAFCQPVWILAAGQGMPEGLEE